MRRKSQNTTYVVEETATHRRVFHEWHRLPYRPVHAIETLEHPQMRRTRSYYTPNRKNMLAGSVVEQLPLTGPYADEKFWKPRRCTL